MACGLGQGILTTSAPKTGRVAQRTGVEGPGLSLRQRSLYGMLAVAGRYLAGRAEASAAAEHWLDAPASSWRWCIPSPVQFHASNSSWQDLHECRRSHNGLSSLL